MALARRQSTGSRPPQPNLLHDPDEFLESDDDQPPPYSRYDPLAPQPPNLQQPPQLPPRHRQDLDRYQSNERRSRRPSVNIPHTRFHGDLAMNTPPSSPPRPYPAAPASPRALPPFPPQQYRSFYQTTNPPFQYPPGYFCPKCYNLGMKHYNGSPCGTCARLFGRQTADVQPNGMTLIVGKSGSGWLHSYTASKRPYRAGW